jgi:hypothetical protein
MDITGAYEDLLQEGLGNRRKTDAPTTPMREALSTQLLALASTMPGSVRPMLTLAAETLARDEAENAAMINELVRAGYRDIGSRVNTSLIKRLLGYITPV